MCRSNEYGPGGELISAARRCPSQNGEVRRAYQRNRYHVAKFKADAIPNPSITIPAGTPPAQLSQELAARRDVRDEYRAQATELWAQRGGEFSKEYMSDVFDRAEDPELALALGKYEASVRQVGAAVHSTAASDAWEAMPSPAELEDMSSDEFFEKFPEARDIDPNAARCIEADKSGYSPRDKLTGKAREDYQRLVVEGKAIDDESFENLITESMRAQYPYRANGPTNADWREGRRRTYGTSEHHPLGTRMDPEWEREKQQELYEHMMSHAHNDGWDQVSGFYDSREDVAPSLAWATLYQRSVRKQMEASGHTFNRDVQVMNPTHKSAQATDEDVRRATWEMSRYPDAMMPDTPVAVYPQRTREPNARYQDVYVVTDKGLEKVGTRFDNSEVDVEFDEGKEIRLAHKLTKEADVEKATGMRVVGGDTLYNKDGFFASFTTLRPYEKGARPEWLVVTKSKPVVTEDVAAEKYSGANAVLEKYNDDYALANQSFLYRHTAPVPGVAGVRAPRHPDMMPTQFVGGDRQTSVPRDSEHNVWNSHRFMHLKKNGDSYEMTDTGSPEVRNLGLGTLIK